MASEGYNLLIGKLNAFIRKYYKNQMLRGVIYSVGLILGAYLFVVILEAFGKFGTTGRTLLFWFLVITASYVFSRFILIPLFKLMKLGKVLSHEEASEIVGDHFPSVKDKLLNTIQLQAESTSNSSDLLAASIDQRTQELRPVPFTSAVDFKENRKYLKYVIPPLALFLVLLFAATDTITESTSRLIKYNQDIRPEAPFQFSIENDALSVAENDDLPLSISMSGDILPEKAFIEMNGSKFRLNKSSNTSFDYVIKNVQKDMVFRLFADGFYSEDYNVEVLLKPAVINFQINLEYPAYTGYKPEQLKNNGDLTIPAGTRVQWVFDTRNTEDFALQLGDKKIDIEESNKNRFSHTHSAIRSLEYSVHVSNEFMENPDNIEYQMSVIPDQRPGISVVEEKDSLNIENVFFTGEVKDDYGFTSLNFKYEFVKSDDPERMSQGIQTVTLPRPDGISDSFFYHWSLNQLALLPGDEISYYFQVWDNDGVNGAKSARTLNRLYAAPTEKELEEEVSQENEEIKDKLDKSIEDAQKLQKELDDLRKDLMQKENLDWQDKKRIEDALNQQKELQKQVEQVQQSHENKKPSFEPQSEELMEKQEQLQELFDKVMSEEMKEMYEELEKLMEEMNKEDIQRQLEEMNMSNEELEKELDRALEQFKQLEWEMKMEDTIEDLKELAEKQEELSKKSEDKNADSEKLKEEQEKLNEEFEDLQEKMDELDKMNEELEDPNAMPDTQDQEEQIKEEMKDSAESLEKKKNKKASESQKGASEKMEEMAQKMEMMMAQDQAESMEEDMEALRALLENIISLSFDQETLMQSIKVIEKDDPKYTDHGQTQKKLKDDAKMVEDSLFALSKRIFQLAPIVNKEIGIVNENMDQALVQIPERKTSEVTRHQQYVMTSFNNLALLLDEALQQMQQESSCDKPGKGNCEKPGGKGAPKPSAGDMKKMQEALSKQLEQMKEKMGQDANKGEGKSGKGGMSKEIAQMAAKQAAIRQMMEKMGEQLNEDGSGNGNGIKKIAEEMEEIEEDLVNRRIDQETLKRQEDILIRLLKAEDAERQREQDNKRKSKVGDQNLESSPMKISEYEKQKQREIELLRTIPPSLKPYYKEKVNDYFNNLGK